MQVDGVHLLDWSMDADHNRSVVTIAGEPAAVVEAAVRGAGKAAETIDLTRQQGVHPRIGAADVIPFVPVKGSNWSNACCWRGRPGLEIWRRFGVPVYFYEAAADAAGPGEPGRRTPGTVRRSQRCRGEGYLAAPRPREGPACILRRGPARWGRASSWWHTTFISIRPMWRLRARLRGRSGPQAEA